MKAINSETGNEMYGYVLINTDKKKNELFSKWKIETGSFFDGECFVYGTMMTGDNGGSMFFPCGINCIGFDNVCPGFNEAYV